MQAKEPFQPSLWPFVVSIVGVLCTFLLAPGADAGHPGHPRELVVVTAVMGLGSLAVYAHFVISIVQQTAEHLGISVLTIPVKA